MIEEPDSLVLGKIELVRACPRIFASAFDDILRDR
jgi:hypothetical protein